VFRFSAVQRSLTLDKMPFNAMGFREYASFLMEEFRVLLSLTINGQEPSFPWERNQKHFNQFVFAPQYSFCRISRK
jgi:hypothetical protein